MPSSRRAIALFTLIAATALSGCADDKVKHFAAGAGVSAVTTHLTGSQLKGCAAALAVGLAKEAWDSTGRGQVEAADVAATTAGCVITFQF